MSSTPSGTDAPDTARLMSASRRRAAVSSAAANMMEKADEATRGRDEVGCIIKKSKPKTLQQQFREIEERQSESRIAPIMLAIQMARCQNP